MPTQRKPTRKSLSSGNFKHEFNTDSLFKNLTENEKKELLSSASIIFTNPTFKKIYDEIFTILVLELAGSATQETLLEYQGKLKGIDLVFDTLQSYHVQYVEMVKKNDEFDKFSVI
ncbi:MAG: hypothetical protein RI965_344 [Bacteroidota bacterium]|jgi:hypothetical protein